MPRLLVFALSLALSACASTSSPTLGPARPPPKAATLCAHEVPGSSCVRCHPSLVESFKARGDWCPEHDLPETQCLECHPGMLFAELEPIPEGADFLYLSTMGEDVPSLEAHAPAGKVTVFDFYAAWCVSCRDVDAHLRTLLKERPQLAVRKLNVMNWDSPIAGRYLKDVSALPYVVVVGPDGETVAKISGVNPEALERALDKALR